MRYFFVLFLLLISCDNNSKTKVLTYLCVDTKVTNGNAYWFGTGKELNIYKSEYGINIDTGGGLIVNKELSSDYNFISVQKLGTMTTVFTFNTITEKGNIDIRYENWNEGISKIIYFECREKK